MRVSFGLRAWLCRRKYDLMWLNWNQYLLESPSCHSNSTKDKTLYKWVIFFWISVGLCCYQRKFLWIDSSDLPLVGRLLYQKFDSGVQWRQLSYTKPPQLQCLSLWSVNCYIGRKDQVFGSDAGLESNSVSLIAVAIQNCLSIRHHEMSYWVAAWLMIDAESLVYGFKRLL